MYLVLFRCIEFLALVMTVIYSTSNHWKPINLFDVVVVAVKKTAGDVRGCVFKIVFNLSAYHNYSNDS